MNQEPTLQEIEDRMNADIQAMSETLAKGGDRTFSELLLDALMEETSWKPAKGKESL